MCSAASVSSSLVSAPLHACRGEREDPEPRAVRTRSRATLSVTGDDADHLARRSPRRHHGRSGALATTRRHALLRAAVMRFTQARRLVAPALARRP